MVSEPDQAGAAEDQFDSDREVSTSSAAEELQRRNRLNLFVKKLKTKRLAFFFYKPNQLLFYLPDYNEVEFALNSTFKFYGVL